MPRDLPSAMAMLVNFDSSYCVRDSTTARGRENQLWRALSHRPSGRTASRLAPRDAGPAPQDLPDTLITDVQLEHRGLQIRIHANDAVCHEHASSCAICVIHNDAGHDAKALFFHYISAPRKPLGDTRTSNRQSGRGPVQGPRISMEMPVTPRRRISSSRPG